MNPSLRVRIAGLGAWLPGAPDWPTLRNVLLGQHGLVADTPAKPAAEVVPAAERRRAPDGVRLASEVAAQACAASGLDPALLPCVFASTHGELAITDYVCETLAHTPLELSPTKFHNSVLNAPAGYWTIATSCTAASSAVTAHHASFAVGLFEAAVLACADNTPVLFALCDVAATGPLIEMARTTQPFGVALVLAPDADAGSLLDISLDAHAAPTPAFDCMALRDVAGDNPANADALALLSALVAAQPSRVALRLSPILSLAIGITP